MRGRAPSATRATWLRPRRVAAFPQSNASAATMGVWSPGRRTGEARVREMEERGDEAVPKSARVPMPLRGG